MLPLLSYKLYRFRKDKILKNEALKPKEKEIKSDMCPRCKVKHKIKFKKPTTLEIWFLLFGMFGVFVSYLLYWNLAFIWNWTTVTSNSTNSVLKTEFVYCNLTIDFMKILRQRLNAQSKYKYEFRWNGVDRRSGLSHEEYREMYSGKWPVIITDCGFNWPAYKKWNKDFFKTDYGNQVVSVKTMKDGLSEVYAMPMQIFLSQLSQEGHSSTWTYLNDEMFIPSRPELLADIGSCKETVEDFFSMFPPEIRPWWAFLLWGTRHSRSDLHIDPFNWTGTNFVISGLKRWKLYPPGQDHLLNVVVGEKYQFPLSSFKYNSPIDAFAPDVVKKHPLLSEAKVIEFFQYPGELLIIPSGWFHQAYNEEETLAVSGQLLNEDNHRLVLAELMKGSGHSSVGGCSARDRVRQWLDRLGPGELQRGREASMFVYDQLLKVATKSGLPPPPLHFLQKHQQQQSVDTTQPPEQTKPEQ